MTPETAGTIAQVDVGLFIALVVETKTFVRNDAEEGPFRWAHTLGFYGTFVSSCVTLIAVIHHKDLDGTASAIAGIGTILGFVGLYFSVSRLALKAVDGSLKRILLSLLFLGTMIWFFIWYLRFTDYSFWI
jgi:hypothetical protein